MKRSYADRCFRKSAGETILTPWNGCSIRRSLSPLTIHSAFPKTAHSSGMLSAGSRQAFIGRMERTRSALCRSNRKRVFISTEGMASSGRIKTSASSESKALEQTSSNVPAMNSPYSREGGPLPKRAETKTLVSRTTRVAGIPAFSHIINQAIDLSKREFLDSASASYSRNHLVQLCGPRFLLQFVNQPQLLAQGQLFYDRVDVNRDCYGHEQFSSGGSIAQPADSDNAVKKQQAVEAKR